MLIVLAPMDAMSQSDSNNQKSYVARNYKKNNEKPNGATKAVTVKDSDGDGIPDTEDLCPDIPGHASSKGCPDSDGDGIPDFEDDCPNVYGLAKYKGCPDRNT